MFLPGLAEIKMLYEQLQSNRMFNNRRATRSVAEGICVFLWFLNTPKCVFCIILFVVVVLLSVNFLIPLKTKKCRHQIIFCCRLLSFLR